MKYEVEVVVRSTDASGKVETSRSYKETWSFQDNPRWVLGGEAYALEETAGRLAGKIRLEAKGGGGQELNDASGTPRRA
jgi:hypothetical protein